MGEVIRFRAGHSICHGTTALGPHAIFVKVIYTLGSWRIFPSDLALCGLHEFLRLNVADIHEGKSEKVSRTVSASPLTLNMTVMSTSWVIASPPEVPVRNVLPLATVVSIMDAVSTGTPFVVPPAPGIERPEMQAQDFSTCRLSKSCEFLPLFRQLASFPAPTLPRDSAKDSSPSLSLDRVQPLRGNTSPLAGEALLQAPADDCVASVLGDPNTAAWCEQYQGSESPWSLPGCATVRALRSALRISTTLPEGSSTSATPWPRGRASDYSLDCRVVRTDTRSPAICCVQVETRHMDLLPHPIQSLVNAGCRESFRLQSRRAIHVWTMNAVPGGIKLPRSDCVIQILPLHNQPDGHSYDGISW